MALEVPGGLTPKPVLDGTEILFAFRGSDGIPVGFTAAQLKIFIGSGLPSDFFVGGKVNTAYMIPQKISGTQFQQLTVSGVLQDIEHNMDWFNAAVRAVGAIEGWGTGTPATPLAAPVVSSGAITDTTMVITWTSVTNAATYDIYRGSTKVGSTASLNYTDSGLTASTSYAHYVRAVPAAGAGYSTGPASNTVTATTSASTGLPTPEAPVWSFNPTTRILTATHALGTGEMLSAIGPGSFGAYAPIQVDNLQHAAGYGKAKTKAVAGVRNESPVAESVAIDAVGGSGSGQFALVSTPTQILNATFTPTTAKSIGVGANDPTVIVWPEHLVAGTTGKLRAELSGMPIGLGPATSGVIADDQMYFKIGINGGNGRISYSYINSAGEWSNEITLNYDDSVLGALVECEITSTQFIVKYSNDAGATFNNTHTVSRITGVDMSIRVNVPAPYYIGAGEFNENVKQIGFIKP